MIYARRSIGGQSTEPPESNPVVGPPPSGSFAVYIGGAQVFTNYDAGTVLAGTSVTLSVRVQNGGAGSLNWIGFSIDGVVAPWMTNTSGGATVLSSGDYQDLVFTVAVPSSQAEGEQSVLFNLSTDSTHYLFTVSYTIQAIVVEPPVSPPAPPTGVVVTGGDGKFVVAWVNSATATSHLVRWGTSQGGPYTTGETQVAVPTSSLTVSATNGTKYFGVVYAQNDDTGTSGPSVEFAVTPAAPIDTTPTDFTTPTNFRVISIGQTFVEVAYDAVTDAETYHVIVYDEAGTSLVDEFTSTTTSLVATGLTASTTYTLTVYAVETTTGRQSHESDPITATTNAASDTGPGGDALPREQTMTVYMITDASLANQWNVTNNIRKVPAIRLSGSTTMASLGLQCAQAVALMPENHRALYLPHFGHGRTDAIDIFAGETPYSFVESQGYALDSVWTEKMEEFSAAFVGLDPKYVMFDFEETDPVGTPTLPYWEVLGSDGPERASKFAGIFANATLRNRLPVALRNSSVAELATIDNGFLSPKSVLAGQWNHYILSKRAHSMAQVFTDAFERVTGIRPIAVNYQDVQLTRAYAHWFGMPQVVGNRSMSNTSNPPLYLETFPYGGTILDNDYRDAKGLPRLTKARRWNVFIYMVNLLRSLRYPIFPWVARNAYNGNSNPYDANPQNGVDLLKHIGAMGIDRIAYFNPTPGVTNDTIAEYQQVIERVRVYDKPARRLPVIPFDADSVTTGAITTTYNEAAWTAGGTYDPISL